MLRHARDRPSHRNASKFAISSRSWTLATTILCPASIALRINPGTTKRAPPNCWGDQSSPQHLHKSPIHLIRRFRDRRRFPHRSTTNQSVSISVIRGFHSRGGTIGKAVKQRANLSFPLRAFVASRETFMLRLGDRGLDPHEDTKPRRTDEMPGS